MHNRLLPLLIIFLLPLLSACGEKTRDPYVWMTEKQIKEATEVRGFCVRLRRVNKKRYDLLISNGPTPDEKSEGFHEKLLGPKEVMVHLKHGKWFALQCRKDRDGIPYILTTFDNLVSEYPLEIAVYGGNDGGRYRIHLVRDEQMIKEFFPNRKP